MGPWRDGSVYIYMLDTTGYIWFHGAFPHLYEFTIAGRARDAVTGEVIYDAGPRGGPIGPGRAASSSIISTIPPMIPTE